MPRKTDRFVLNTSLLLYYELYIQNEAKPNAALISRFVKNNVKDCKTSRDTIVDHVVAEKWDESIELVKSWGEDEFNNGDPVKTDDQKMYDGMESIFGELAPLMIDAVRMARRGVRAARNMKPKSWDSAHNRLVQTIDLMLKARSDPKISPDAAEAVAAWVIEAMIEEVKSLNDPDFLNRFGQILPGTQKRLARRVTENVYITRQKSKEIGAGRTEQSGQ